MQKYLAVALIMNANKTKYEALWNKLENDLLIGQDSYPTTIGDATHLLTNWKASTTPSPRPAPASATPDRRPGAQGVNFVGTEWAALVPVPSQVSIPLVPLWHHPGNRHTTSAPRLNAPNARKKDIVPLLAFSSYRE
jgi:hypothetical protein